MPRNGSGTYALPANSVAPAVSGTTINPTDFNTVMNDVASAMTQSISSDGQTEMTGPLNLNNNAINNVTTISASGGLVVTGAESITSNLTVGGTLSVTGGETISAGGGWSGSNWGKQLLVTTPSGLSNPAIGITDSTGATIIGISNGGGTLNIASMPPVSNGATAPVEILQATTAGFSLPGMLTVAGSGSVTGNLIVDGNTSFGTGGFAAVPNNAGNQLLQFAPGEYLQFNPGDGFYLVSTGNIHLTGALTVNGNSVCYNNGATYGINITGSAGSAGAVPWSGVTGKPYAFNQSTDVGTTPSFSVITTTGGGGWTISQTSAGGGSVTALDINQAAAGPAAVGMVVNMSNVSGIFSEWQLNGSAVGSITTNGSSTSYNTTSDARLKTDCGTMAPGLCGRIIDRLRPRWFAWKDSHNDQIEAGFFAQEVARVFPQAVTRGRGSPGRKDFKPWQMDHSKLIPLLIAEIQSLRSRVAALEK